MSITLQGDFKVTIVEGWVEGIEAVLAEAGTAFYEYIQGAGGEVLAFEWGEVSQQGYDAYQDASFQCTWPPGTTDGFDDPLREAIANKIAQHQWTALVSTYAR